REALDDAQGRSVGVAVRGRLFEIGRLDDEGAAFEAAARVAEMLADLRADVRTAVERDESLFVQQLIPDRDEARGLHDLVVVAVHGRDHRAGDTLCYAALEKVEVFGTVERAAEEAAPHAAGGPRRAGRRQRRNFSVGRIDDRPRTAAPGEIEVLQPPAVGA